ncbi:MAG TPA: hypothetical protein VH590_19150, partial [Ktedonobacterales bacterium]
MFREDQQRFEAERAAAEAANPEFYTRMRQRLAEARKRLGLEESETAHPVDDASAEKTLGPSAS